MEVSIEDKVREASRQFWAARRAVEEAECPARLATLENMGVTVTNAGGNCPVQIEGNIGGEQFYFRARGDHWSLGIGDDPIGNPEWFTEEPYGEWPDAGWMPLHEAYGLLITGLIKLAREAAAKDGWIKT